jgi:hypothetical protein
MDWTTVQNGTSEHPCLFDMALRMRLFIATKVDRKWEYVLANNEPALSGPWDRLTDDARAIVASEVVRAYCAYTTMVAGRPMAPSNALQKKHVQSIAALLYEVKRPLADMLRYFHDIRGISFMSVRLCSLGYLAGAGQQIEYRAYLTQQQQGVKREGRAAHVVNTYERASDASDTLSLLRANGFGEATEQQAVTVDAVLRNPRTWCSDEIKQMVEVVRRAKEGRHAQ